MRSIWWIAGLAVILAAAAGIFFLAVPKTEHPAPPYGPYGMILIDIGNEDTANRFHVSRLGVYVLDTEENSEAWNAGVRAGDFVVSVNGAEVSGTAELEDLWKSERAVFLLERQEDGTRFEVTLTAKTAGTGGMFNEASDRG